MPTLEKLSDSLREKAAVPTRAVRRPRFRHALISGAALLTILIVGSVFRSWRAHSPGGHVLLLVPAAAFAVAGVICTRAVASEADDLARRRGGHSVGATIRLVVTMVGYLITALGALSLTTYPIDHLLLGGAIVGVVVGIAAQQSLGNVFAGLVLLSARPFTIGQHIRVRSGALGGEFEGRVLSMSLTYVTMSTTEGVLKVPNSSVFAAAVGPKRPPSTETGHSGARNDETVVKDVGLNP